jgi:hypothetical protein
MLKLQPSGGSLTLTAFASVFSSGLTPSEDESRCVVTPGKKSASHNKSFIIRRDGKIYSVILPAEKECTQNARRNFSAFLPGLHKRYAMPPPGSRGVPDGTTFRPDGRRALHFPNHRRLSLTPYRSRFFIFSHVVASEA